MKTTSMTLCGSHPLGCHFRLAGDNDNCVTWLLIMSPIVWPLLFQSPVIPDAVTTSLTISPGLPRRPPLIVLVKLVPLHQHIPFGLGQWCVLWAFPWNMII